MQEPVVILLLSTEGKIYEEIVVRFMATAYAPHRLKVCVKIPFARCFIDLIPINAHAAAISAVGDNRANRFDPHYGHGLSRSNKRQIFASGVSRLNGDTLSRPH